MKSLISKLIFFSGIFLLLTVVIGFVAYEQVKYQPQANIQKQPEFICGNVNSSTENYQNGEVIFKVNCVACHKKYKDAYGPALQRFIQRNDSTTVEYLSSYFDGQQKLNLSKQSYNEIVSDKSNSNFVHQQDLSDEDIIYLVEYITD